MGLTNPISLCKVFNDRVVDTCVACDQGGSCGNSFFYIRRTLPWPEFRGLDFQFLRKRLFFELQESFGKAIRIDEFLLTNSKTDSKVFVFLIYIYDFATRTLIFLGRFEAFASGDVRTFLCRPHLTFFRKNLGKTSIFGFVRSPLLSELYGNLSINTEALRFGNPVICRFLNPTQLFLFFGRAKRIR